MCHYVANAMAPIRKLNVCLTGNEINKACSDMTIDCWTREFVLFCDTFEGAKEKYRGMFEIHKSGDKTSSGEIGLDIRTHASPKSGTGPGEFGAAISRLSREGLHL